MTYLIDFLDRLFRPRHVDWRQHGNHMRRWTGSGWEVRTMTSDEVEEAAWWNAVR